VLNDRLKPLTAGLGGGEVWENGELRCAAVESKVTSQQKSESLTLQLQANMILLSANILTMTCKHNPTVCETIRQLTCYGLLLTVECMSRSYIDQYTGS